MTRILALLLAAVALALAASCGGDDDDGDEPAAEQTTTEEATTEETTTEEATTEDDDGGEATTLDLAADPGGQLAFDTDSLTAPAGEITIHLVNDASIPHNVAIEGSGVDEVSETVTGGETDLTVTLEPGEYTFYCAVGGHRAAGMEGTLTVE